MIDKEHDRSTLILSDTYPRCRFLRAFRSCTKHREGKEHAAVFLVGSADRAGPLIEGGERVWARRDKRSKRGKWTISVPAVAGWQKSAIFQMAFTGLKHVGELGAQEPRPPAAVVVGLDRRELPRIKLV